MGCAPQQILFLYLKRNRRSRIFLFFFFSRRRRIMGTFTLWSRIEEEEYFLSSSFHEKKKKNIFLLNTKYPTLRKGVVPLIYRENYYFNLHQMIQLSYLQRSLQCCGIFQALYF